MNVYKKLQQARLILGSMKLKKSGLNKFAGYQYFELGDFLMPTQQIFSDVGLCGVVSFTPEIATLKIFNVDAPEEVITFTSPMGSAALKGCHEVQNVGAVETYQRRYLYVSAMEIVEHDALDSSKPIEVEAKKTTTATDGALAALDSKSKVKAEKLAGFIESSMVKDMDYEAFEAWETEQDQELKIAVWSLLGSKTRSTIKSMKAEAEKPVAA